jgi:Glycosyltransferase Family 4
MRVLVLHSRYRSGALSGENRTVDDEVRLLREAGHEVHLWSPSPEGLDGAELVRTGLRAVWSRRSASHVAELIRRHRPEVVHCHNLALRRRSGRYLAGEIRAGLHRKI